MEAAWRPQVEMGRCASCDADSAAPSTIWIGYRELDSTHTRACVSRFHAERKQKRATLATHDRARARGAVCRGREAEGRRGVSASPPSARRDETMSMSLAGRGQAQTTQHTAISACSNHDRLLRASRGRARGGRYSKVLFYSTIAQISTCVCSSRLSNGAAPLS